MSKGVVSKGGRYQQLLPMDENDSVKNQFGWLPTSVYRPVKAPEIADVVADDGDISTRRSADCKYLPSLRYSEFSPDFAEIAVRYWSEPGMLVVDPFAGRATRGVVALTNNRRYEGYEIAPQTFAKTTAKISDLGGVLYRQDGCEMPSTESESADLVFTCPPYHQLEKYESWPGQLSDIPDYGTFLAAIRRAALNIKRIMKRGAFLVWVCADWRDGKAFRLFHRDSLVIFEQAGLTTHDVVILHNISPFAPLQAGKVAAKRYTAKTHEYALVFRKAEARNA